MSPFDDNPPVNLQLMQAAAIALSDADGDYKIAARILRDLSAVDGTLREAIFAHGLGSAVRAAAHEERQKIKAEIIAAPARAQENRLINVRLLRRCALLHLRHIEVHTA